MITFIIQARRGSTRLPGKVLKPLLGKPMLSRELERVKRAKKADAIIVATTDKPEDDAVAKIAAEAGVKVFRGDENDVLDRYYRAAKEVGADVVVRITGDCPLHDPSVIDEVVTHFEKTDVDYALAPTNYPEGLDTEVFRFSALETAWKEAQLPSEREHVTPFIRNHPERFTIDAPWRSEEVNGTGMHWSVDTEPDFTFVAEVYKHLYHQNPAFGMNDVLALLAEHPELKDINKGGTGFEGLEKSLEEDEEWKKRHV